MKKTLLLLALGAVFFSCNKEQPVVQPAAIIDTQVSAEDRDNCYTYIRINSAFNGGSVNHTYRVKLNNSTLWMGRLCSLECCQQTINTNQWYQLNIDPDVIYRMQYEFFQPCNEHSPLGTTSISIRIGQNIYNIAMSTDDGYNPQYFDFWRVGCTLYTRWDH